MGAAYREYLELFEYFGRGGLPQLTRQEFEQVSREFDQLLGQRPNLTQEQIQRILSLRELLLRDRPRVHDLVPGKISQQRQPLKMSHCSSSINEVSEEISETRYGATFFRQLPFGTLRLVGQDRVDLLHRISTADIKGAPFGTAVPSALLTPKAKVISTLTVVNLESETLCIVPSASVNETVEHIDRLTIADDVEVITDDRIVVGLYGPRSTQLATTAGFELPEGANWARLDVDDVPCLALADDHLAVPGAMLLCAPARAARLCDIFTRLGARRASNDAYEICRVEAGSPRMGKELSQEILILEAGQLQLISFAKGCYPGQEPVCRVHSRGQVNRLLVGLEIDSNTLPATGEGLSHPDKAEAGRITSAVRSPLLQGIVGLGYVHRKVATPGTTLSLSRGGNATVVALPHIRDGLQHRSLPRYSTGPNDGKERPHVS